MKELTGDKRSSKMRGNVRCKDGTLLFEKDQVPGRWNEYISELFEDVRPEIPEIINQDGPPIINSEVELALKSTSLVKMVLLLKCGRRLGSLLLKNLPHYLITFILLALFLMK